MTDIVRQLGGVAIDGRAVLIDGASGSGKSSLALALIDRGAHLIGDDGVTLRRAGRRLWAQPPPNIAGLLEIRNVGIVELPTVIAPVALLIRLDTATRHVERAEMEQIGGCSVPSLRLFPETHVLHLRVEWALRQYGLRD